MSTTDTPMPFSPGLFPTPSVSLPAGPKLTQIPLTAFPANLPGPRPGREFRRAVARYGVVIPAFYAHLRNVGGPAHTERKSN